MGKMKFYWIFFALISFASCDIPGVLIYKNKPKKGMVLRIHHIDNSPYTHIKTNEMNLRTRGKIKNGYVLLGFGHVWNERKTNRYVNAIEKIEILTPSDTFNIKGQTELKKFFATGKTKFFKKKLIIKIPPE